jgi:hypothetical protein
MVNLENGRVAYAVLSFGGFLGLGNKLFAVPWKALLVRPHEHAFALDISKEILEKIEGFDKDDWPLTLSRLEIFILATDTHLTGRQGFGADKKTRHYKNKTSSKRQ